LKTRYLLIIFFLLAAASAESAEISLIISHPSISPNSDGRKDFSQVSLTLENSFDTLTVTLEDPAETATYDSLLNIINPEASSYGFLWTGKDSADNVLPDGEYLLHLQAVRSDTVTQIRRTVIVDTDAPSINIDRIEPGIFSPAIPGDRVMIYYSVSGYSEGCTAGGSVIEPDGDVTNLDIPEIRADSSYSYEWNPSTPQDGIYTITLSIEDLAGNRGSDEGSVDVDADGPVIDIDPVESPTSQPPSLISGNCYDKSTVDSLRFTWTAGDNATNEIFPDTVYVEDDTTYWNVSIYDSIYSQSSQRYIEDNYTFSITAWDSLNQSENQDLTFTIDVTPPPPPVLAQPTSTLLKPEIAVTYLEKLGANVRNVRFYTSHQGVIDSVTKSAFIPNPVIALEEGKSELWARSIDQAGNISENSNLITVEYRSASRYSFPEVFRGTDLFRVTTPEDAFRVRIRIFTLEGEEVRNLTDDGPAEYFELEWDLTTNDGEEVRNGAYLVVITSSLYNGSRSSEKYFISVVR